MSNFVSFSDIKFILTVFGILEPELLTTDECLALYHTVTGRNAMTARNGLPCMVSSDDLPKVLMRAYSKIDH